MKRLLLLIVFLLVSFSLYAQWVPISGPNGDNVVSFAASGTYLLAGAYNGGVYLSTDNGTSWVSTGLGTYVRALAIAGTNFFAGDGYGVHLSTDNGSSWAQVNNGLTNTDVMSLAVSGTNLFAGTKQGIFLSTNNGSNWVKIGFPYNEVNALAVSGTNLFAGTFGGVFLSTNNGTSWSQKIQSNITALAVSGTNLFSGTYQGGIFLSTDYGTNWTEIDSGLTNNYKDMVDALVISGTNIFAGIHYNGVWRRSLSDIITGIENQKGSIPFSFSLQQNYPNPFNPTTKIKYDLPKEGFVTLKVYDMLGREVATLINKEQSAGQYIVTFDASGLSSGIYFYRMQTGSFVQTKKLILMK